MKLSVNSDFIVRACIVAIIAAIGFNVLYDRFDQQFTRLHTSDYVYYNPWVNRRGLYALSNKQDQIIYMSATTKRLTVIDITGRFVNDIKHTFDDQLLQEIERLEWPTTDTITYVHKDRLVEFNLTDFQSKVRYESPSAKIDSYCWANNGKSLYIIERLSIESRIKRLLYQNSEEDQRWHEVDANLSHFLWMSCSKESDKILLEQENKIVSRSNDIFIRKNVPSVQALYRDVTQLDQIPEHYFALNSGGGRSVRYCVHYVNYDTGIVYPLYGPYWRIFGGLDYSPSNNILILEKQSWFSEHTQLYWAELSFSENGTPNKELVKCEF